MLQRIANRAASQNILHLELMLTVHSKSMDRDLGPLLGELGKYVGARDLGRAFQLLADNDFDTWVDEGVETADQMV